MAVAWGLVFPIADYGGRADGLGWNYQIVMTKPDGARPASGSLAFYPSNRDDSDGAPNAIGYSLGPHEIKAWLNPSAQFSPTSKVAIKVMPSSGATPATTVWLWNRRQDGTRLGRAIAAVPVDELLLPGDSATVATVDMPAYRWNHFAYGEGQTRFLAELWRQAGTLVKTVELNLREPGQLDPGQGDRTKSVAASAPALLRRRSPASLAAGADRTHVCVTPTTTPGFASAQVG